MSFPRYPKYKPSGVEWLGEVPENWSTSRFQRCVHVVEGQVDPELPEFAAMPLIAPNHIESGTGRLLGYETADEQGAESGKYPCKADDVLYSKIRPALRKVCIAPVDALCSADMYPLRAHSGLDGRFLFWYLLCEHFSAFALLESQRVAMPKINRESLKPAPIILPPLPEQRAIAAFLDRETAKIDALVAEQERLVELLAEKRQAVISHAVTKGLDPAAPMKPSGVEWLGDVPAHWDVARAKVDISFVTSGSRGWAGHYSDDGAVFIRIANLTRDSIKLDLRDVQRVRPPDGAEGDRTLLRAGDVLFSITAYLGSVAVVPELNQIAYMSQHVAMARLRMQRYSPKWLAYLSLSVAGQTWFDLQSYGGTKVQLGLDDILCLPVIIPPLTEQEQIVNHVERRTTHFDELIATAANAVELLKERRAALISAAVTGQIDVRGAAAAAAS